MPASETQEDPWLKPVAKPQEASTDPWLKPVEESKAGADPWLAPVEGQAVPTQAPPPATETKPLGVGGSIIAAANVFADQTLSQPSGQFAAAKAVVDARTGADEGVTGMLSWIRRVGQLSFPKIGDHPPTTLELQEAARSNPELDRIMRQLDHERELSHERAKAYGDNPDWGEIWRQHLLKDRADLEQQKSQGGPLDPRSMDNDALMRHAFQTAVPGVDRPPLTGADVADAGWQALKVQNAAEIAQLPSYVQTAMRALAEGAKFGLLSRVGMGPGTLGAVAETGRQALGVASGAQEGLEPGQILLSAALMKGASGAAGIAKAAGRGAAVQTAAQIGTFEAASLAGKAVEGMRGGKGAKEDENRGALEKLLNHILDVVVTAGTAAVTGGHGAGERVPKSVPDAAPEAPVESVPKGVPSKPSNFEATEITAKALKETLSKLPGRGETTPERITERSKAIESDVVPAVAKIEEARYQLERALKKAAPGDKALQNKLNEATRITVQTDGAIPIPEVAVVPEAFTKVLDAQMKLGEAGLSVGRLLNKYGALPDARYQQPGTTSDIILKAGEEPPPGAKLVGGLQYAEQNGHYFPQITAGEFVPEPPPPVVRKGGSAPAPLQSELAAGHLQKRQLTFDEAFQQRPLDLSYQKAYEVYLSESDLVRKQAWLDLSRANGDLLTDSQLPDAAARANMAQQVERLDKDIKAKRQALKLFSPEDQLRAKTEIAGLLRQRGELEAASKVKLYKKLVGKEYGQYEGMWLHKDALAKVRQLTPDESAMGTLVRLANAAFKTAKVGFNTALIVPDFIGNVIQYRIAGVNVLRNYARAVKANLGGEKNSTDHLFDAYARKASLGGPTDVTADDVRAIRFIDRKIQENIDQGKGVKGLKLERLLAARHDLLAQLNAYVEKMPAKPRLLARIPQGAINGLMKLPHWRQALVDQAAARSAFHELIDHGIGDSGPMKPQTAFEYIQGIADYRTLPQAVQTAAKVLTFVRWPSKLAQSAVIRGMQRRPNLYGVDIPTPMDAIIRGAPGSPAAQAALVARGMLRLATTGAEALPLLLGSQKALAAYHHIPQKELDQALEERFGYLPGPVAWLSKITFQPTGRDAYGQIEGIDAGQFHPAIVAMRYFSQSFDPRDITKDPAGFAQDVLFQLSQKNVLLGAAVRAVGGLNTQGKPVKTGFGPGESGWGLETLPAPAVLLRPLEAYFQQQNVPQEERSTMRDVLRSFLGVPMTVLPDKDYFEKEVDRLYQEGVIGISKQDNGVWSYYVKNPKSLDAIMSRADKVIEGYYNDPLDQARMARRRYHQLQHMLDSVGR